MKETFEAITADQDNLKDKKIIDLAKKNRGLQLQVESLKTKAAKAAEIALKLKKDNNDKDQAQELTTGTAALGQTTLSSIGGIDDPAKKIKELEKRITKLRNDNQHFSTQLDKATRLLEREIGEVVDIDSLSKEESQWKGRAQKVELLKL